MTEENKNIELMESIQKLKWSDSLQSNLAHAFEDEALLRALNMVLVVSDEKLLNVGHSDLTNPEVIKTALRTQGEAAGMVSAVELLIELATKEIKDVSK